MKKKLSVVLTLAGAMALPCLAQSPATQAQTLPPVASVQLADPSGPVTRAQVRADRNIWLRAGLAEFAGVESYVAETPQYQESLARYQRMRQGPEYTAELQRQMERSR